MARVPGNPDRDKPSWRRRLRIVIRRLKRVHGTPHEVALGFSVAAFWSILPTPALSIIFGFAMAAIVRMSKISLTIGFATFNPLVCVFLIYPWALPLGRIITEAVPALAFENLKRFQWLAENGVALTLGSAIAGLIVGTISYFVLRRAIVLYRQRKAIRDHQRWLRRHPTPPESKL